MQKQAEQLSEEDKKILEEAHKNRDNPKHPAHKDHPEVSRETNMRIHALLQSSDPLLQHGQFLKSIPKRLGGAAIFGAGATAGADAVNSVIGN